MTAAQGPVTSTLIDTIGGVTYAQGSVSSVQTDTDVAIAGKLLSPGSILTKIGPYKIGGKDDIDLTAVGTHHLFVVSATQEVIIQYIVIRCTSASGVTVTAKVGAGVNAEADNIFTSRRLYGLTNSGLAYVFAADGGGIRIGALVSVRLGIDEGATATSQIADVDLMGYAF